MKSKFLFSVLILFSLPGFSSEFQASRGLPEKINCAEKKGKLFIAENKQGYQFYEKIQKIEKIHTCEKISLTGSRFYTVTYSAELNTPIGKKKVLIYEVMTGDKSPKTLRSEVIDEVDLNADLPSKDFSKSFQTLWGQSEKDKKPMLQITLNEGNEKPFSFLLKMNKKNSWLENVF